MQEEIAFEIPQIATGNEAPIQLNDGKSIDQLSRNCDSNKEI